ncbi:MAG: CD1871A family CXXC motif-containing protein [Butyricicoccus pullicaecorum]|nr:CD1871A family CXXC motif-containing protein [Butyricicoccus pullicaecorum]
MTRRKAWIAPALLLVGIGMMIYGVMDGEAEIVLRKAATICLECIGVG